MKKITRAVFGSILIASVILASVVHAEYLGNKKKTASAEEVSPYFVDKNGKIKTPSKDPSKPRGTAENPFFVLEIVPWDQWAEFGYQIAGCEPVDLAKMGWEGKTLPDNGVCLTAKQVYKGYWPGEMPAGLTGGQDETLPRFGIMTKTTGTGNYKLIGEDTAYDPNGNATSNKELKFAEQANGDYTFTSLTVEEVHAMSYNEKLNYSDKNVSPASLNDAADGATVKVNLGNVTAKVNYSAYEYTHKNNFLKYAIGLAYDMVNGKRVEVSEEEVNRRIADYHAIVYTVTPEDLNLNTELIDKADMITICQGTKMGYTVDQKYLREDLFSHDDSTNLGKRNLNKSGADFAKNPIDWEVAKKIYGRACGNNGVCPILVETASRSAGQSDLTGTQTYTQKYADGTVKNNVSISGTQNNMYKLLLMMLQMETSTFCQLFQDTNGNVLDGANFGAVDMGGSIKRKDGQALKTGTFKLNQSGDGVKYWEKELFYPYHIMTYAEMDTDAERTDVCTMFGIGCAGGPYNWLSGEMQNAVRGSMFQYNGATMASSGMHNDNIASKEVATDDDLFGYKIYDIFEQVTDGRPAKVDTADVIWAMLNQYSSYDPNQPVTADLRILDLEPSSKYTKSEAFFRTLLGSLGNFNGNVTITQMNTSEFIGKKVDLLSDFDIVYIGTDIITNNFSNKDMWSIPDDFIYAHTGRVVTIQCKKATESYLDYLLSENVAKGWDAEINTEQVVAYSGNDITKMVLDKLVDARNNGLIFMYGPGFFTDKDMTKAAISGKVDHNSYLYEFANNNISGAIAEDALNNASNYSLWNTERTKLRNAIQNVVAKRVSLDFSVEPKLYKNMGKTDAENFINPTASDPTDLKFRFTVNAPAGNSYFVRVYVDANGDGTFTENEGNQDTYEVRPIRTDNGQPGGAIQSCMVEAGKEYQVTKEITDRIGSVHWKLELVKNGTVFFSKSGLSAIKQFKSEDLVELNILQILTTNGATVILPDNNALAEYKNGSNSITGDVNGNKLKFLKKIYNRDGSSMINGMNITFTVKKESEIISEIGAGANPSEAEFLKYLMKYNMIVVGFGDNYKGITKVNLADALESYRKKGLAVLYTHDNSTHKTKSLSNIITSRYRNEALLSDRYSLMEHPATDVSATRKDYPWVTSATSSSRELIKITESVHNKQVTLAQGYSNGIIYRYVVKPDVAVSSQNITDGNTYTVSNIKVINEGAITSYPYDIPDTIGIASTHMQYYQLDMENEELNVWYTLDSTSTSNDRDKFYGYMRGDVRNNFYIYNAGNVTYSGMGHDGGLTDKEVELFVNTFVAAYRAAAKSVELVVTNSEASKKGDNYFVAIDVDSSDSATAVGTNVESSYKLRSVSGSNDALTYSEGSEVTKTSKRVYFYIKDGSSSGTATHYVLTAKVAGVTDDTHELAVYQKSNDAFISKAESMKAGRFNVYYVDVPLKVEEQDGKKAFAETKLELTVTPWVNNGGTFTEVETMESVVTIMPRGLFDLD